MKKNVGNIDKVLRLVVIAILIYLYVAKIISGWLAIVAIILAVVLLFTAISGYCHLYTLLGISTVSKKKK